MYFGQVVTGVVLLNNFTLSQRGSLVNERVAALWVLDAINTWGLTTKALIGQ
jgi:hypothetical protein